MAYSRDFFEGLGYIVYALSKVDGVINVEEQEKFAEELIKNFGSWASDTKGLRAKASYEIALEGNYSIEQALKKAEEHFSYVKSDVKKSRLKILDTIENIAFADKQLTESEKELLDKIKEMLKNIVGE